MTQQHFHSPLPRKPPSRAGSFHSDSAPTASVHTPSLLRPLRPRTLKGPTKLPLTPQPRSPLARTSWLASAPPSPALVPLPSPSGARAHTREQRPHECRHRQSSPESHTHARPPVCRCTREPGPAAHFLRPPAPPATRAHPPRGVGTVRLTHQRVAQAPAVPVTPPCAHTHPVGLVPVSHVHTHVHARLWHVGTLKNAAWSLPVERTHAWCGLRLCLWGTYTRTPTRTRHGWFRARAHTHAVVTRPGSSCHMRSHTPRCLAPPAMRVRTHAHLCRGPWFHVSLAQARARSTVPSPAVTRWAGGRWLVLAPCRGPAPALVLGDGDSRVPSHRVLVPGASPSCVCILRAP